MIDPICGMEVEPSNVAGSHLHDGQTYLFCSHHSLAKFKERSGRFLRMLHEDGIRESSKAFLNKATIRKTNGAIGKNYWTALSFRTYRGADRKSKMPTSNQDMTV